jgi:hypothetical protein
MIESYQNTSKEQKRQDVSPALSGLYYALRQSVENNLDDAELEHYLMNHQMDDALALAQRRATANA